MRFRDGTIQFRAIENGREFNCRDPYRGPGWHFVTRRFPHGGVTARIPDLAQVCGKKGKKREAEEGGRFGRS